ncbi:MAG TPA: 4Fe-4S binding protein [Casimicrobiaceae bacterium]|nr:4Fe-4S binding protein [Casimicrobiaceae bacterium]
MSAARDAASITASARFAASLAALGEMLRSHARTVRLVQWIVVAAYLFFVIVPALLPLPSDDAHWYNNLAVLAQWLFWGLWWPFVILSMLVFGRAWCGFLCPEGTLTEAVSGIGLGRAVPQWMKWGGWPFVAFALTTVVGQLVSVYQYAPATLLILGGSTVAAVGVGLVYGRGKRVWCRYLCPVNGVFAVLAKLSPVHFRVDTEAWTANASRIPAHPVNCAPLVRIRRMTGPSECHMCARCSGLHGAIALSARSPESQIAALDGRSARPWDAALIVFGMIGLAIGAFEWSASSSFVALRSAVAGWVIDHGPAWLLLDNAPWWLLTHYPEANDVFTWLDGALIASWIVVTALVVGAWVSAWLAIAARSVGRGAGLSAVSLAHALTPLAAMGLFVGLSSLTVALARGEGWHVPALTALRITLLLAGAAWALRLASRQIGARGGGARHLGALGAMAMAVAGILAAWAPFVFHIA